MLSLVSIVSMMSYPISVDAANPNLYVSAENPQFDNHIGGSMIIEVIVEDHYISEVSESSGEPHVTINGDRLRMTQSAYGSWYGYFAHVDMAQAADGTVAKPGEGLDFGVFCSADTDQSVFGISLRETEGFAVPSSGGLSGFTNGEESFSKCTGTPTASTKINNVLQRPPSMNLNGLVPSGQIGLDPNAWPLVQLYDFDTVDIVYRKGGASQTVTLHHDEIPNIKHDLDRDRYPSNAHVYLTIHDPQLNQDPTSKDSWTFGVGSTPSVFYRAFDDKGNNAANGGSGLVDISRSLNKLGFVDNGLLEIELGTILETVSNTKQPTRQITDGSTTFSDIITLVEQDPNSGIFDNTDRKKGSNLKTRVDAPRGHAAVIEYNDKKVDVLTGSFTAGIQLQKKLDITSDSLLPGILYGITLSDPDRNTNPITQDVLDLRNTPYLPTLRIGKPITLDRASDVWFSSQSTERYVPSVIRSPSSAILSLDTSGVSSTSGDAFTQMVVDVGISATQLRSVINSDAWAVWLNYDVRSLEGIFNTAGDIDFVLYFGTRDSTPMPLTTVNSPQGLVRLSEDTVNNISQRTGDVYLGVEFTGNPSSDPYTDTRHVAIDIFSFGDDTNNSIYRFELEETDDNTSRFEGTLEYIVLTHATTHHVANIRTIDSEIKFVIIDEDDITISYSDLSAIGKLSIVSSQSEIGTTSGVVAINSKSYRFGQTAVVTLHDPDLNIHSDRVDYYTVVDDPNSPAVDTVGEDDTILLEILLKDIRYKRCSVGGVQHGGLAATGFVLTETDVSTGTFEGTFSIPTKICNRDGTALISPTGGSLDVVYYDARDSSGNPSKSSVLRSNPAQPIQALTTPQVNPESILRPITSGTVEVTLSGTLVGHQPTGKLEVNVALPDGTDQRFPLSVSNRGAYVATLSVSNVWPLGTYQISLYYNNVLAGSTSFLVSEPVIPTWVKSNAGWWAQGKLPNSEFLDILDHLVTTGFISTTKTSSVYSIPPWLKSNAAWWSNGTISDDVFIRSLQYAADQGILPIR